MLSRKEKILESALYLFANEGYDGTATSKIAKHAGVSEGLIFKHFENKRGLLVALSEEAQKRAHQLFEPILTEEEPHLILQKMITMPFEVPASEYDFWRLHFKLKWNEEYRREQITQPIIDKMETVFRDLNYPDPIQEAKMLFYLMDTIAIDCLRDSTLNKEEFLAFLLTKYGL